MHYQRLRAISFLVITKVATIASSFKLSKKKKENNFISPFMAKIELVYQKSDTIFISFENWFYYIIGNLSWDTSLSIMGGNSYIELANTPFNYIYIFNMCNLTNNHILKPIA